MWGITVWSAMEKFQKAGWFKNWKPVTGIFTMSISLSDATRGKWYPASNDGGKRNSTCCTYLNKQTLIRF